MSNGRNDTGRCRLGATAMGSWLFVVLFAAMPIARAAPFTVTSTADTGGSTCGATCTLRQAINVTNAAPGADVIHFAISGAGVQTITPATPLPTIVSPVTIDGYTQPGSSVNTASTGTNAVLKIELNGANAAGANGLSLGANSSPSAIRGLVINGFKNVGGAGGNGIRFLNLANTGGTVTGCFIGTNASGTAAKPNDLGGIMLPANYAGVTIGGTALADRNLISGNSGDGIDLLSANNVVQGNLIGVGADGSSLLGNARGGVLSQGSSNLIGGTAATAGNVIAGNAGAGVLIASGATGVRIERNAMFGNGGLGIDLSPFPDTGDAVTANDAGDGDAGSNNFQNYPVLTAAGLGSGLLVVQGTLNSAANRTFRIEFFVSNATDHSSFGEGQKFLGSQNVPTDAAGNGSFNVSGSAAGVTSRQIITATATDTITGDTSEFSAGMIVVANTTVVNANDSGAGSLRQAILNANSNAGSDTIDFAIPGAGVHVIHVLSALPTITGTATIDGYTQYGASTNTLADGNDAVIAVRLDGSNSGTGGLAICAPNTIVRGMAITGFDGPAIYIGVGTNTGCPGGTSAADGSIVEGNYIGLFHDGSTVGPNSSGVRMFANARIGGAEPAQRNVISGNSFDGIFVGGTTATRIDGNYIGTDAGGQVGRGNGGAGIFLTNSASDTQIGFEARNRIAYNQQSGIAVVFSAANRIAPNDIHDNTGAGIDLGVFAADGITPNDTNDLDTGGNDLQNFPVITALTRTPTGLSISGSLDRPATGTQLVFAIGVYANAVCNPFGLGGGGRYLGSFNFVSANSGVETFTNVPFPTTAALPVGTKITTTATDPAGNTSEFSQCAELDTGAQTFVVNSTLDVDDENCTVAIDGCTLREAISAANGRVGADFITFNIPGSGVHIISPASPLPTIIDAVTIDGYTQPGALPNTLADGDNAKILVQVDGLSAPANARGFAICANDVSVQGLSITRFDKLAIVIGSNSGGTLCPTTGRNVQIYGNFIGLAPDGSAAGNFDGVLVNRGTASIGGSPPAKRNIVSSSVNSAITVVNASTAGTAILGNYIGTNPSGTQDRGNAFNGVSINLGAFDVTVGGSSPNRIAFNGTGIAVVQNVHLNTLFANDFFSNEALAIDLGADTTPDGPTANDADDADDGGNDLQNFPVLTSAVQDGPNLHVAGSLDVPAGVIPNSYVLAFYANASCDGGARGQGEMYLGYVNVELSGASQEFNVQLAATAPLGSRISSTATASASGDTSEFSTCVTLTAGDHIFANGFD